MPYHLEHFRGNESFVRRLYDQIELMQRRRKVVVTSFFTPEECDIAQSICGNQIPYKKDGGYAGAERCRFAFLPYADEEAEIPISMLCASVSSAFCTLTHRDVLGALMHIGIEREKIGDLIVEKDAIYIFVDPDIENYIICNLTKIKRCSVHLKHSSEKIAYEPHILYSTKIVSSLRLDAIVSALVNVSRKKAQEMIRGSLVKVNHVTLEESSYLCNNNSAISIRGYGRFIYKEVIKTTKKEHFVIEVGRYQ